jgi:hypothetical protein
MGKAMNTEAMNLGLAQEEGHLLNLSKAIKNNTFSLLIDELLHENRELFVSDPHLAVQTLDIVKAAINSRETGELIKQARNISKIPSIGPRVEGVLLMVAGVLSNALGLVVNKTSTAAILGIPASISTAATARVAIKTSDLGLFGKTELQKMNKNLNTKPEEDLSGEHTKNNKLNP